MSNNIPLTLATATLAPLSLVTTGLETTTGPQSRRSSARAHQPSLAYRRRALAKKIKQFKTIIAELEADISNFSERAIAANSDATSAKERVRYCTQEITRITQEELQGNSGIEYARALRHYNDYRRANPNDVEGIRSCETEATRLRDIINATTREIIKPLRQQTESNLQLLTKANEKYKTLNDDISALTRQKHDLQNELDTMTSEYRVLTINQNIGQGNIMRKSKKKGKRGKKGGAWTAKYKKSINCRRPRGFSQKQYCKYGK
jgi:chromosome segregation ATPase